MTGNHNAPRDDGEPEYRGIKIHAIASLHEQCMGMIQDLNLRAGARVLDLGAGEGAFSQRLVDAGYKVSAAELERGRFQLDVPCINVDLNTDFHDQWNEKFELVVAIEILEHLHDPRHFIKNCLQALESNGRLLVTSPNVESWLSRIKFLRDGHFLWFEEADYHTYGHLTPIFSWQMRQICLELGAEVVLLRNTRDSLLRKRLGDTFTAKLRNKTFYLSSLYPLMRGQKDGEINIYLINKRKT